MAAKRKSIDKFHADWQVEHDGVIFGVGRLATPGAQDGAICIAVQVDDHGMAVNLDESDLIELFLTIGELLGPEGRARLTLAATMARLLDLHDE